MYLSLDNIGSDFENYIFGIEKLQGIWEPEEW